MGDIADKDTELCSLVMKLQQIDVGQLSKDESVKLEALELSRKVTATIEGPVNRATDLAFRASTSVRPL
jgi:hypothetical protein